MPLGGCSVILLIRRIPMLCGHMYVYTYGVRGRDVLLEVCTMVCAAIRLFGMTTGTFLSPSV